MRQETEGRKQQIEHRIDELAIRESELRKQVGLRIRAKKEAVEAYTHLMTPRWEYLQVSGKEMDVQGSLNNLGSEGWELIGISNFTEKKTSWGTVEGTIYTMYVFKRRIVDVPEDLLSKFTDIDDIKSQIAAVRSEVRHLQEELSML
jgi:hypothetical protein